MRSCLCILPSIHGLQICDQCATNKPGVEENAATSTPLTFETYKPHYCRRCGTKIVMKPDTCPICGMANP